MAAPLFGMPDSNTAAALVTRFVALSDVPSSYAGQALKGLRVNAGETGLEFATITTTFVGLTDGPGAFSGNALKGVRVNAGATALEYVTLVSTFVGLTDGPGSFTSNGLKGVRVNAGATALEYFTRDVSSITDGPGAPSGNSLKGVRVNVGATALEYFTRNFLSLTDVPASYSGQAGYLCRVKATEDGIEFATVSAGIGNEVTFADTTASAPSSGNSKLYSLKAGVSRPAFVQPDARRYPIQPHLSFLNKWEYFGGADPSNAATFRIYWLNGGQYSGSGTTSGSATTSFVAASASTDFRTSSLLIDFNAAGTAADNVIEHRGTTLFAWMGNAAGRGGFFYHCRFGPGLSGASFPTNFKFFIGLQNITTAFGTGNPSTRVNCLGIGCDPADTNMSIIHNDGSGTATLTGLGSTYPARSAVAVYDFYMFVAPNTTTVEYYLVRADTGDITSGSYNSDIPSSTTFLTPTFWASNGNPSGTLAAHLSLMHAYMEYNS